MRKFVRIPDSQNASGDPSRGAATGVVGIVLAAGRSRRMGRPKVLLPLEDGRSAVEVLVSRLQPHVDAVVAVAGHLAGQVAAVLARLDGVRLAVNEEPDRGMLSSVQCGLRAAGPGWRGYLICLGDQPLLSGAVVATLLDAASRSGKGIAIPTYQGRRGHPLYLGRTYLDEVLALDVDLGLNAVTRAHPEDTCQVPVDEAWVVEDMDRPADYARLRARSLPAGAAR